MQDYIHRISYLYAYEYGLKTKNVGFAKLDKRGDSCRLEVRLRPFAEHIKGRGKVYIYFYHREKLVGIPLGELEKDGSGFGWRGDLNWTDIEGTEVSLARTEGIWLKFPDGKDYVAPWLEDDVDISRWLGYPAGGKKCFYCPRFGTCEKN